MKGHPKFNYEDKVKFKLAGQDEYIYGTIYIIDKYGTFFDNSDVSYDIMTEDCLYKHINERLVEAVDS
jgi:hypothetical protein